MNIIREKIEEKLPMGKYIAQKKLLLFLFAPTLLLSSELIGLQYTGVTIFVKDTNASKKTLLIEREIDPSCLNVSIDQESLWSHDYAKATTPNKCKGTFVTTVGQIQPIVLSDKIETYGELEVMNFMSKMEKNKNMLLIDTREESFYTNKTIPSSINIPFEHILQSELFEEEYEKALELIGIKKSPKNYDFKNSKEILLFCNGPWCSQSPRVIKKLIQIGYPQEKIKWYRGGMHDWLGLSMTATSPKP